MGLQTRIFPPQGGREKTEMGTARAIELAQLDAAINSSMEMRSQYGEKRRRTSEWTALDGS